MIDHSLHAASQGLSVGFGIRRFLTVDVALENPTSAQPRREAQHDEWGEVLWQVDQVSDHRGQRTNSNGTDNPQFKKPRALVPNEAGKLKSAVLKPAESKSAHSPKDRR